MKKAEIEHLNTNLKHFLEIDDMSVARTETNPVHRGTVCITESRILYPV